MPDDRTSVQIAFRPAFPQDFDYCAELYFAGMATAIRQPNHDMEAKMGGFRTQWDSRQVRIVTRDNVDIGWLQTAATEDALFLAQLFVEATVQRQGIGTEVMGRVIAEAAQAGQAVTLGVVKTNSALRLYERLGFKVTHEDSRKFYMRRTCDAPA